MPTWLKFMVAEAVGTFFLVFPGAGAPMLGAATHSTIPLLDVALANGLGLGIGITATMAVSGGALNPAVTIGLWSLGKLKARIAILYIIAELVGAIVAAALLAWLVPGAVASGTPAPGSGITGLQAAGIETILTFLLMTAVLTTAVDPRAAKIGGFGVGLVVVFDVLVAGPLTGAAMNPARAFGPELISGVWSAAWAYWVGPIAGALVAALIYRYFLQTDAVTASSAEGAAASAAVRGSTPSQHRRKSGKK